MEFNATIIVSAVSFIVFIFIMNKILYQPILNIIEERANYINSNLEEALNHKNKAQAILDDKQEKIKKAHKQAKDTMTEGIENSTNNKANVISRALTLSREKIDTEKIQLSKEEEEARAILKSQVSDLAKDISEKLLGQPVHNIEYDHELVEEAMNNA